MIPDPTPERAARDLAARRDLACELAIAAGRLQMRGRATVVVHGTKAHANDLVSDVDHASERLIVDGIRAVHPDDGVLGEEGADTAGDSGWRWVIDPLDGTRNYLTGAGPWSVCIALECGGVPRVGVVHDPAAGETFSAVAGGGARLGGARLRASQADRLDEAIVGLSFNPSPATRRRMAAAVPAILPAVGDIRRVPSALNLAYLAAGRFDAGLLIDTQPWDVAAGLLVAAEAGVVLGGADGEPSPEFIVAAAPGLWGAFAALTRDL